MSSSRMGTNGASLEDCHTNVFALTELNGLKWKCVTTPPSHRGWISIDQDPVLSAYAKCLQAGILCAWRRQPSQMHSTLAQIPLPDYRIDVVKELWVFWYSQDEPELLAQYTSHLSCGENGRGNLANAGIPYEIRTLYFKALHNLIERSLIKSGYVRIGRYFVRPYDVPSSDRLQCLPSYILGISFNFFVHGENIVCTCVSVQKQPAIFRLSAAHLELKKRQPVILGPWSLRAHLIPKENSDSRATNSSNHLSEKRTSVDHSALMSGVNTKMEYRAGVTQFDSQQQSRSQGFFDYESPSSFPEANEGLSEVEKLWSDWELFFGLCSEHKSSESSQHKSRTSNTADMGNTIAKKLPKMVLVDVDGVRMWFPSSLIVVQSEDDLLLRTEDGESSSNEEQDSVNINVKREMSDSFFSDIASNSENGSLSSASLRPTTSFVRKKKRKRRDIGLQQLSRNRINLMYNSMVNGSRAAQRYLEEACILPPYSRRRESVDALPSLIGSKNEDDTKWNLTDGLRGAECNIEQHSYCPCHLENSFRTPIPSTSSGSHYGNAISSCAKVFPSTDSNIKRSSKWFKVPFHLRISKNSSPSSSTPLSPNYDLKHDRGSPDWIYDHSSRNSSLNNTKGRSDSFESSGDCGDSPIYRRLSRLLSFTNKKSLPLFEDNKSRKVGNSFFGKDLKTVGSSASNSQIVLPSSAIYSHCMNFIQKDGELSSENTIPNSDCNMKYFIPKRLIKKNHTVTGKRKIGSNRSLGALDMLFMTTGRKLRNRMLDYGIFVNLPASAFNGVTSLLGAVRLMQLNSALTKLVKPVAQEDWKYKEFFESDDFNFEFETPEIENSYSSEELEKILGEDVSRDLSFAKINMPRVLSSAYEADVESHITAGISIAGGLSTFASSCNASPAAAPMLDTEGMNVTDSVHLSPPASNERVEPVIMPSTLSGPVTNNLLARVGGPPSVGDYKIYPTPPSVDAVQSQQFSPQSMIIQSSCNSVTTAVYTTTAVPCVGLSQPPANSATISRPLRNCSSIVDHFHDNLVDVKDDITDEFPNEYQGKFVSHMAEKLPVFGRTIIMKVVLCGKYGPSFKEELSYSKGTYFDKRRQALLSFAARLKRKHIAATPFYHPFREDHKARGQRLALCDRIRGQFSNSFSSQVIGIGGQSNNHGSVCMSSTASPISSIVHPLVSSPVNSSLMMRSSRSQLISYSQSSLIGQHTTGFISPSTYCPSNILNSPSQMNSMMHSSANISMSPQGLGIPSTQTPVIGSGGHSGIDIVHGGVNSQQQQQQPFQQLSQFVNNATFSNQQGNFYGQQHYFQQSVMPRGTIHGNMVPQYPQSSRSYSSDSQMSTSLEPPPSFSEAMNTQYCASGANGVGTNINMTATGSPTPSSVFNSPPQMMRQNSFLSNSPSPVVLSVSRPLQNLVHPSLNSSLGGTLFNQHTNNSLTENSVLRGSSTSVSQYPEGNSLALAVLLQDTVLDLHYDSAFDACPLCSCNGNIRTKELGMYITPPEILRQSSSLQSAVVNRPTSGFYINNNATQNCNCGFSAIRHRYLSMKAGLFPEDAIEATDITDAQSQPVIPHTLWFDPISKKDIDFIALLCEHTLVHDLSGFLDHVSLFATQCKRAVKCGQAGEDHSKKTEYIVSDVDQRELPLVFQAACEVACMEMNCRRPRPDFQSVLWHDWGVQIANEMYEPREAECLAVLNEIGPVLEETLRKARSAQMGGSNNIVEGPLTWRHFDRKSLKTGTGIEDDSVPEPIPNILAASEKDAISISPQALRLWEKMLLEPYDQPKDVLYIAVVPDNSICIEKSKKYFDDLSRLYEQCRFGRHLPFVKDTLRDGFLRIPTRVPVTTPNDFLKQIERHITNGAALIAKLNTYMQYVENELSEVVNKNSYIFSRDSYRALLIEHQVQNTSASATANCTSLVGNNNGSGSNNIVNNNTSGNINDQMPPPTLIVNAPSGNNVSNNSTGSTNGGSHSENTLTAMPNISGPSPVSSLNCAVESLASTNVSGDTQSQSTAAAPPQIPEQIAEGFAKDEPGTLPHVIVLYLVNPFLVGADESPLVARVVTVALMRAFTALLDHIDLHHRPQLQMEIIGLQTILDYTGTTVDILKDECGQLNGFDQGRMEKTLNERLNSIDAMKTVAFSVYTQSRILLPDVVSSILPTSMTRFGPASAMNDLLEKLRKNENPVFYKVPSKPFILAPPPPVVLRPNNEVMQISTEETVLFVSYCLIGLDFLAAAVTDHQGHLLDNCLINLRVKPDHKRGNLRYKQSTQIRDSLYRLWSYILGTLATGTKNWRLVIGKVGRIGHGEFKFWTQLLSKSYLKQVPSRMKQACRPCHQMPGTAEVPGVLSACLVSLEPEANLRVFSSSFQHDERFAKNARYRSLNTPDDASCTHILVFPTSPELNLDHQGGAGGNDYDDFSIVMEAEIPEEFSAIIKSEDLNPNAAGQSSGLRLTGNTGIPTEYTDVFENQPLAAGYYISTAPASELPEWFWSACPSAKRRNPVHLKSSLHLNTNNVQQGDDIALSAKGSETCQHQLDSQSTVDVLRYVLEMYNALSWLNVDLVTGERRSCLPVHIQALMRLCSTVDRLIN